MNWKKLKEDFPNTYPKVREFSNEYKGHRLFLMPNFVESMGKSFYPSWINGLREIEKELENKTN